MWKLADVTPLPKKKPVKELKKDLRPISFTPCISRFIERFIVDDYVKPAVMSVIDTDGNCATVRTILFDYRKAFDFIDHD